MSLISKKRRFNFVSETGDGIGFAVRLRQDGHVVRVWIRDQNAKSVGDGLVEKVGDLEDLVNDAVAGEDIFVFDVTSNGLVADLLRDRGFAVLAGSSLADHLERDRAFGKQVMQDAGIDVPETFSFDSFAEGVKFVEKHNDERWVYKPSKQLGDLSPSHVSYDAEDLIEMLHNIEKDVEIEDPQFELQLFEPGVAVSTELWFQNGELISPLTNHTLERKELMNDDLGPSGGCLGNIVWLCDGCPLCQVAGRLTKWAERERYHGMLDLNAIASPKGVFGLEFTPRFGYDATPTFFWELIEDDIGDVFAKLADGMLKEISTRDSVIAGALRVTLPPWPSEKYQAEENVPIRGLDESEQRWKHDTYVYNVKASKDDSEASLVSAGAWGILLLLTHQGTDLKRIYTHLQGRAKDLKIKNKQYRTDLAKRFEEDLEKLAKLDMLTNSVVEV